MNKLFITIMVALGGLQAVAQAPPRQTSTGGWFPMKRIKFIDRMARGRVARRDMMRAAKDAAAEEAARFLAERTGA